MCKHTLTSLLLFIYHKKTFENCCITFLRIFVYFLYFSNQLKFWWKTLYSPVIENFMIFKLHIFIFLFFHISNFFLSARRVMQVLTVPKASKHAVKKIRTHMFSVKSHTLQDTCNNMVRFESNFNILSCLYSANFESCFTLWIENSCSLDTAGWQMT